MGERSTREAAWVVLREVPFRFGITSVVFMRGSLSSLTWFAEGTVPKSPKTDP